MFYFLLNLSFFNEIRSVHCHDRARLKLFRNLYVSYKSFTDKFFYHMASVVSSVDITNTLDSDSVNTGGTLEVQLLGNNYSVSH